MCTLTLLLTAEVRCTWGKWGLVRKENCTVFGKLKAYPTLSVNSEEQFDGKAAP